MRTATLARTLIADELVDNYRLMMEPIVRVVVASDRSQMTAKRAPPADHNDGR